MRILVFSDTHGNIEPVLNILRTINGIDACIHCGDILKDCYRIETEFPELDFYYVCGNNDYSNSVPKDLTLTFENKKIFVTHGHLYRVKTTLSELRKKTENGYDLVLYGHTHIPNTVYHSSGIILNPGSFNYISPTYAVVEIENNKLKTAILNA